MYVLGSEIGIDTLGSKNFERRKGQQPKYIPRQGGLYHLYPRWLFLLENWEVSVPFR